MPIRQRFTEELDKLQRGIVEMGALVVQALEQSVQALTTQDCALANEIIENDPRINQSELRIDDTCALLIAEEQPVARDLRLILNSMRTSHTLERIADNAVHVSKSTVILSAHPYIKPLVDIRKISALAVGMVKDSLDVYVSLDIEKAKEISKRDQKVDAIYADIFKELITQMHKDPDSIDQALTFLFVCRRLERIADHSTHICEGAIYVDTGEYVDLNR